MKLLMAVSSDGFLASGPSDDMKWTGKDDKSLFRLLTLADRRPLLAGAATARQMPPLKDRLLVSITNRPNAPNEMTLDYAAWCYPEAWLIGGPTIALAAMKMGLVDTAYLSVTKAVLGSGAPVNEIQALLPYEHAQIITIGDLRVRVYLPHQQWPGK